MADKEKWFSILVEQNKESVNLERVDTLSEIDGYEVLEYVLRTRECLDTKTPEFCLKSQVRRVLEWSEVAKCGNNERREDWQKRGFNLSIHNLGSAQIYELYADDAETDKKLISGLIKLHGMAGQYVRGEISPAEVDRAAQLLNDLVKLAGSAEDVSLALKYLTQAVIEGVSEELYLNIKDETDDFINKLFNIANCGRKEELLTAVERIHKIKPTFNSDEMISNELVEAVDRFSFWYPEVALSTFTDEIFIKILCQSVNKAVALKKDITDIDFKKVSSFLYYDYQGKKHINVYKKRIVENLFKTGSNKHIKMTCEVCDNVLIVGYELSPVCEKLVDFCNEAEISGDISYEQAIVLLFDFFEFRQDTYDRLNNESEYLATMNDISTSRKGELINYVIGDTVVDVGSGSGILLDRLEEQYPDKRIVGTDISSEVISTLKNKAKAENHSWQVYKHNFVEGQFKEDFKVQSIIFSSIIHEIYSYTPYEGTQFNKESVRAAITNAYNSIEPGGRIVIRDGIKTAGNRRVMLKLKTREGRSFFESYLKDFKGLPEYDRSDITMTETESENSYEFKVEGDINYIREFMYTYTWGVDSFFNEVKEQFGYYTLDEFKSLFGELSAKVIKAEEYFEEDYYRHLHPLLDLCDLEGNEIKYPNSNCIVVVEKP